MACAVNNQAIHESTIYRPTYYKAFVYNFKVENGILSADSISSVSMLKLKELYPIISIAAEADNLNPSVDSIIPFTKIFAYERNH